MSGQVFDRGAVISFQPGSGSVKLSLEQRSGDEVVVLAGWAVVVVDRKNWVMMTRVEPVGNCPDCGMAEPLISHLGRVHEVDAFWSIG
jgi:hypothetical protein